MEIFAGLSATTKIGCATAFIMVLCLSSWLSAIEIRCLDQAIAGGATCLNVSVAALMNSWAFCTGAWSAFTKESCDNKNGICDSGVLDTADECPETVGCNSVNAEPLEVPAPSYGTYRVQTTSPHAARVVQSHATSVYWSRSRQSQQPEVLPRVYTKRPSKERLKRDAPPAALPLTPPKSPLAETVTTTPDRDLDHDKQLLVASTPKVEAQPSETPRKTYKFLELPFEPNHAIQAARDGGWTFDPQQWQSGEPVPGYKCTWHETGRFPDGIVQFDRPAETTPTRARSHPLITSERVEEAVMPSAVDRTAIMQHVVQQGSQAGTSTNNVMPFVHDPFRGPRETMPIAIPSPGALQSLFQPDLTGTALTQSGGQETATDNAQMMRISGLPWTATIPELAYFLNDHLDPNVCMSEVIGSNSKKTITFSTIAKVDKKHAARLTKELCCAGYYLDEYQNPQWKLLVKSAKTPLAGNDNNAWNVSVGRAAFFTNTPAPIAQLSPQSFASMFQGPQSGNLWQTQASQSSDDMDLDVEDSDPMNVDTAPLVVQPASSCSAATANYSNQLLQGAGAGATESDLMEFETSTLVILPTPAPGFPNGSYPAQSGWSGHFGHAQSASNSLNTSTNLPPQAFKVRLTNMPQGKGFNDIKNFVETTRFSSPFPYSIDGPGQRNGSIEADIYLAEDSHADLVANTLNGTAMQVGEGLVMAIKFIELITDPAMKPTGRPQLQPIFGCAFQAAPNNHTQTQPKQSRAYESRGYTTSEWKEFNAMCKDPGRLRLKSGINWVAKFGNFIYQDLVEGCDDYFNTLLSKGSSTLSGSDKNLFMGKMRLMRANVDNLRKGIIKKTRSLSVMLQDWKKKIA
jgi:hypothetical protein